MGAGAEGSSGASTGAAPADVPVGALVRAGVRLLASVRKATTSLLALLLAEAQVSKASASVVFLACVALVAFAVALWVCVVALIGWALAVAMHSVGASLAVLVGLHVLLVGATFFLIRRMIRRATFPHSRAEFAALRHTLGRDLARFQDATAAPGTESRE